MPAGLEFPSSLQTSIAIHARRPQSGVPISATTGNNGSAGPASRLDAQPALVLSAVREHPGGYQTLDPISARAGTFDQTEDESLERILDEIVGDLSAQWRDALKST